MNLLTRLERPLGWMAVGNLPIYVVTAQVILFVWGMLNPGAAPLLAMDSDAVLRLHEVWRMLTFLFVTPTQNWLWAALYFYFQYVCGQALEEEWGSFPFTVFYVTGALGAVAAAFLVGGSVSSAFFLNETVFLAFAARYPNFQILLFFILPIRVKWIAWFSWIHIIFTMAQSPWIVRVAIVLSLANYFLFFSAEHFRQAREIVARIRHRRRYRDWNS